MAGNENLTLYVPGAKGAIGDLVSEIGLAQVLQESGYQDPDNKSIS